MVAKFIFIFKVVSISSITCSIIPENIAEPRFSAPVTRSSPTPYNGGIAKIIANFLLANTPEKLKSGDEKYTVSHSFEWKKFNNFFLNGFGRHFENNVDYRPTFAMKPRKTGILHSMESSDWFQKLTSHCVNWNPDAYSFNGALCGGMKYFGINLFSGVIKFSDLITCAMIGYATGDGLFCLTWYLGRFFFHDYLPDNLKEHYYYDDGRIRQNIV